MTKKKNDYTSLTIAEYEEFLRLYTKVKDIVDPLGRAKLQTQDNHYEGIDSFNYEGAYVYYMDYIPYGEGQAIYTELIPVDAILNTDRYLDEWEKEIARKQEIVELQEEKWQRAQYEKLKVKFEGKENA